VVAGSDAADVCAFVESEYQFSRALAMWPQVNGAEAVAGMSRLEILTRAAGAARWAGHVGRAIELTIEALAAVKAGQPAERAAIYERLGLYQREAGDSDATLQAYREADRLLTDEPPSPLRAGIHAAYALAHLQTGQYSLGLRVGMEAAEMARTVGAAAELGRALNTVGAALAITGHLDEGLAASREALEIADERGDLEELLRAYANMTFVLENAGRLEEALDVATRGLERSERMGLPFEGRASLLYVNAMLLLELGRWGEAEKIALDGLDREIQTRLEIYFHLLIAEVDIYRGRLDEATRRLSANGQTVEKLREPQSTGAWYACTAELALWRGQRDAVRRAIADGLRAVEDVEDAPQLLRLCALGLRAEADEAQRLSALAFGDPAATVAARTVGADMHSRAEQAATAQDGAPLLPEVSVLLLQCAAERGRLDGRSDPSTWEKVAEGWVRLERPYPVAYARWRQAESLLAGGERRIPPEAATALREAYGIAVRLEARPLLREISALAERARIDLAASTDLAQRDGAAPDVSTSVTAATDPFGLTPRERQVLRYVGKGYTNKGIARELFISEKTASVHVSNILAKLQVSNRVEAAALAHRLGLTETDDREI
jgi:DNA-binding CsgD family transcriptional regulator